MIPSAGVDCRPDVVCKQRRMWERCSRCCYAVTEDAPVHRRLAVVVLDRDVGIAPVRDRVVLDHPPIPTNVVPSIENNAWFWLIGRSWPLHSAQPKDWAPMFVSPISD
jgi:hypothetical protein